MFFISLSRPHICGDDHKWCTNCKLSVYRFHKCYIRIKEEFKTKKFEGFDSFDFESYLNEANEHLVNLAMAQKVYKECLDIPYQNSSIDTIFQLYSKIDTACVHSNIYLFSLRLL